jgi:hypothetical protein
VPQTATIIGTAVDTDTAAIPGAKVTVLNASGVEVISVKSDDVGNFQLSGLPVGVPYTVTIQAKGFGSLRLENVTLTAGQTYDLSGAKMSPSAEMSVDASTAAQIAVMEVHEEEQQRILGIIPNFYVVYDNNVVPLSSKLKYKLALKAATDVTALVGAAFLAGIDQAAYTPAYVEGAKGYGQRVGANYADAASDVLIGGAILPSLLHQDPRYFYQGTGTKKSRILHAISSPFVCRGDDGKSEFNYSSVGGDLISGALTEVYFPPSNRGVGLVFNQAGVTTGGRILNALAQEFLFSKLTTKAKPK